MTLLFQNPDIFAPYISLTIKMHAINMLLLVTSLCQTANFGLSLGRGRVLFCNMGEFSDVGVCVFVRALPLYFPS